MNILEQTFWGNTLATWLLALVVAVFTFLVSIILKRTLSRKTQVWVKETKTDLDNLIFNLFNRTWYLFLVMVAIYAGSLILTLSQIEVGLRAVMVILFWVQVALWGTGVIDYVVVRQMKDASEKNGSAVTQISTLGFVGRVILWTVAVLLALDNIPGIQVDTLVASLGIGGIAVALAVQSILSDLFASFSINLDQPFVVGDFVTVGEYMGTVEYIGLKSTHVRSLTGEQIIFPNSDLMDSRIRNYKRMEKRRVSFILGVTYQTSHNKLVEIPGIVQEIIQVQSQASFDRAHFKECGDFALNFEVVYHVLTSDYAVFMDIQQAINLEILRRFAEEEIEFAYPVRTAFMIK